MQVEPSFVLFALRMCFVSRALNVFPLCFLLNYLTPRCDPRGPKTLNHFPGPLSRPPPSSLRRRNPHRGPLRCRPRHEELRAQSMRPPNLPRAPPLPSPADDRISLSSMMMIWCVLCPRLHSPSHTQPCLQGLHASDCRLHRAPSQKRGAESARRGPTLRRFSGLRGAIAFALSLTVYGASPCAPALARPRSDAPAHARLQGKTAAPSSRVW